MAAVSPNDKIFTVYCKKFDLLTIIQIQHILCCEQLKTGPLGLDTADNSSISPTAVKLTC